MAEKKKRGGQKNPVYVRFGKAKSTPSQRHEKKLPHSAKVPMRVPQPSSPLHKYIMENQESGLSEQELIEQFQEYDCEHKREYPVITSATKKVIRCEDCGRIETKVISDAA